MQISKYQLIQKLATGGMAEVFLAKAAGPMGFEKRLVIKRILPHLAEEPAFVEMFLSEAKLAAQLNHPNIVQIFDFGEAEGIYFLAMEYIQGINLRELIRRALGGGLALSPVLCARIISNACEGLSFAHQFCDPVTGEPLRLVHRDISPDNILVSRQGAVKVVDFGIAKAVGQSHKTQTGMVKGKLAYMPPEQLRNKLLDQRADVYSLGVVFYELLTGLKPFDATTDATIMQAVLFEPLIPAVERRPDLPQPVQRILDCALAKDAEKRYPDCCTFQSELEEFILSSGRPFGSHHIAQFISQLPTEAERPSSAVLPGKTPQGAALPSMASAQGDHSLATADSEAVNPVTMPLSITRTVELPASSPEAIDAVALPSRVLSVNSPLQTSERAEPVPSGTPARKWRSVGFAALLGVALLLGAGGYLLAPGSPGHPQPSASPPVVASAPPEPAVAQPPSLYPPPPAIALPQEAPPRPPAPVPAPAPPPRVAPRASPRPLAAKEPPKSAVTPTPPRATPSPVPPPSPGMSTGTIDLRVRPYARVFLNGKEYGQTPLSKPITVPVGHYTLKLVNEVLQKEEVRQVDVKANQVAPVWVDMRAK